MDKMIACYELDGPQNFAVAGVEIRRMAKRAGYKEPSDNEIEASAFVYSAVNGFRYTANLEKIAA